MEVTKMERKAIVVIAVLALLLVGAIFVSADLVQKSNAEKTSTPLTESKAAGCGCGCNGQCGGDCGVEGCSCGR
jgi:hypothetical protein